MAALGEEMEQADVEEIQPPVLDEAEEGRGTYNRKPPQFGQFTHDRVSFRPNQEGPMVLVRNTFIDVDDSPPSPESLLRSQTTPAGYPAGAPAGLGDLDADTGIVEEEQPRVDDRVDEQGAAAPQEMCRYSTREGYERGDSWSWALGGAMPPAAVPGAVPSPVARAAPPAFAVPALPPPVVEGARSQGSAVPEPPPHPPTLAAAHRPRPLEPPPGGAAAPRSAAAALAHPAPGHFGDTQGMGVEEGSMSSPPQPQTLTRHLSVSTGYFRVFWTVDARKLRGNDKQAVSPPFELSFGENYPNVTFKMMIYPKVVSDAKGGAAFKKSHGRGFVQLKCEAELSEAIANVSFRISIGSGEKAQPPRGPVSHNFSSSAVCGLPKEVDEWDFRSVVDEASSTFVVCLEIVPTRR